MIEREKSDRAGRMVTQIQGYQAFVPAPLPPDPPLRWDGDLARRLSEADQALGRLDGAASILPNRNLFVAMYVRQEAVESSKIEGTQSTLEDVLEYQINAIDKGLPGDVDEVVNYIKAMNHGLARLSDLPLCNRLIREIHGVLLEGVRGGESDFRFSIACGRGGGRNPASIGIHTAAAGSSGFRQSKIKNQKSKITPAVHDMHQAMGDLEKFLDDQKALPVLIHCGLAHAQFETIHPFLDGNGRVGRLLITLLLCQQDVLRKPLLYLSGFFKANQQEYYDRLNAVRSDGDWEGWIAFFLDGVAQVSRQSTTRAKQILDLREADLARVVNARLLDLLFDQPIINVNEVAKRLDCSFATASRHLGKLEKIGLLREMTGQKRGRLFRYDAYLALF